ncbi:hypothetical protein HPAKL86_05150 [Helicobacter pylori Aklavik86]|uniref:Uncharacterized protein n=1 Tax=Helicobacter pylori Aklavik86 TaxID=1055532 RepID=K7YNX1_HELPX|nr:hypothetical protein HPAKL86_00165 [Helicobacter pylori Aklavik86]AFX90027.1 hypothetical protein HPAKL86_05150 [Helicobacter pylori Aklavik86]
MRFIFLSYEMLYFIQSFILFKALFNSKLYLIQSFIDLRLYLIQSFILFRLNLFKTLFKDFIHSKLYFI